MEDVGVGHCVHLGEPAGDTVRREGGREGRFVSPEHNVDDERVSHETTDTDEGVEYLDDRHHVGWQPPAPLITLGQHFAAVILKL